MTLRQKQSVFAKLIAEHIVWLYSQGYEVTLGEAYRTAEQAELNAAKGIGIANSLHRYRLAVDLNLFKDGNYLYNTEDHRISGEKWETRHELCRWGGRFKDGNHYSIEHEGRM